MESQLFELQEKQLRTFRKLVVVGDLHGDYNALRSALDIANSTRDGIIFLGDYADRGPSGVEVVDAVDSLRKDHPLNVFPLKGNHEDYTESGSPRFYPCTLVGEAEEKTGDWRSYFLSKFKPFADHLGLAIIAPSETLFVHGGISRRIASLKDLEHPTPEVEADILWSDPFEGQGERLNEMRGGVGVQFGEDVTAKVCESLGVKRIVRSHEPTKALEGPFYSHSGRVITVSSTSIYGGEPFIVSIDPADFSRISIIKLASAAP